MDADTEDADTEEGGTHRMDIDTKADIQGGMVDDTEEGTHDTDTGVATQDSTDQVPVLDSGYKK